MRRTKSTINTTTPFVTTYGYKDISLDKTTTQLNSISYSNGKGFVYTYDANGNILTIKDQDNELIANYTYDVLNQLTREDNAQLNRTITYTYDNGGNILSVKEYAFTTGDLGSVTNEKTYTYGNTEWKDLLTNYNGTSITYDTIGNPLNWINGETFEWAAGRQLTGITKGDSAISYTYNDDGVRTSKTVNGTKTDYYLNGTAIIMQKTGSNIIWYTYDENGLVTGFRYNGNEYYYFRNGQLDIVGIIDSSGTVVANYTYDSWGKHIAITDGNGNDISTNSSHVANINPFRYRGYFFDSETGLYYLNSRYYDANVGRFLNADSVIVGVGGLIQGYNMISYCFNNPINMTDNIGSWPSWNDIKTAIKKTKNWIENNVINPATDFVKDIVEDVKNYDRNNTDVNKVYESNYISSYKGESVVLITNDFLTSGAFLQTIVLNHADDSESISSKTETINHEYGHIQQEKELGTLKYLAAVGLPSVTCNLLSRNNKILNQNYYNMPWEYNADMRGGVNRGYSNWAEIVSVTYFFLWEMM